MYRTPPLPWSGTKSGSVASFLIPSASAVRARRKPELQLHGADR
jgi:hypothetical protein